MGSVPPAPGTDLGPVADAAGDAAGFVHVGDRFDDDMRYLSRFDGPDRPYALVVAGDRAVLCAPGLFVEQARREFVADAPDDGVAREVRTANLDAPAGRRAAVALADLTGGDGAGSDDEETVLVPQHLPHDAAVYLERAGYELRSTEAVARARRTKSAAERDRHRVVQTAAAAGMRRAEAVLAAAEPVGDDLLWDGAALTTERLRREVNAVLAAEGVRDAGNTVVGAGESCADLHFTGTDDVRPGETVLLDVSPRDPHGYYGDLTRTFVVDGDGGWARRAHVACDDARDVALQELEAGVTAESVHQAAATELAAYGFPTGDDAGFVHGVGHGVGVSLHEAPSLTADEPLRTGDVVTVEPGVYDPDRGGVRIEDLVAVTEDGYELLAEYPISTTPRPAAED
ncbi:MAG: M24 family metallopeptidase [Halolamina sp.]